MSQAVATNDQHMREFQEKVVAKLRADIGEMLPDAALAGLVERAVESQFFNPRESKDSYGRVVETKPSWFVEEVCKQAEPQIKQYVADYVKNNEETIKKAVTEFLEQQNLMLITIAAMRQATSQDIYEFAGSIVQRMKQGY